MNHVAMLGLVNGILSCGFGVAPLLFFKSYATTRDRLFVLFGIAFSMMAVERLLIPLNLVSSDDRPWIYVLRLVAFVVIIYAIADKNRSES